MRLSNPFLPVCPEDVAARGWDQPDFVFVTGDAYVDHPSFGLAIISRVLEKAGYKVAMLPQPEYHDCEAFKLFGRPRLGFLVTSGVIDSMVNHYTAAKKRRSEDAYSPGGRAGYRPDRAVIVYCNRIREAYGSIPILIGGVEASLRRFAHYDYWDDRVRNSILVDSGADVLMYGMGERIILETVRALESGVPFHDMRIPGTCVMSRETEPSYVTIESAEEVAADKKAYARAFKVQYDEQDPVRGRGVCQKHGARYLIANPPAMPLSQKELDDTYALPYVRAWHPMYDSLGGIPALKEVEFSIAHVRGCYGACSFCALTFHQGRIVTARSHESVIAEAKKLTKLPDFKGYIHDVGGPTANFRRPACDGQLKRGACKNRQCLFPTPCRNLVADHSDYISLLRELRALPGVKKVFIRSGIRFDYLLADKSPAFLNELVRHHVSGQLKVAPEHVAPRVLRTMGKPPVEVYNRFVEAYKRANQQAGTDQYLVPYYMSSHPGCTLNDAIELALYIRRSGHRPEQVQDFYPTPGTLSTAMFYTGLDPRDMSEVYVPRSPEEKAMQRALMQYFLPQNRELVVKALRKAGRTDLIGFGPDCLIRPERAHAASPAAPQKPGRAGKNARPNDRRESAPQNRRGRAGSSRKPASDSKRPKR
ncbi:MAG: YgiQ family radical SAM protein [Clostridiales bacterium]|nr:YgiQ family radical SAM protein [Clostridiales bacterium]